jgi:3-dehydroquinate dehydratase-2
MRRVLVVFGANLELLGKREPEIYGRITLDEIRAQVAEVARRRNVNVTWASSNHEGDLVDALGQGLGNVDGVLINPGAFTHTSIAIRDALLALHVPAVEVHLSNIFAREEFRKKSMISDVVTGVVSGLGAPGVVRAFDALCDLIESASGPRDQEKRESSRNLRESA